MATGSFFEDLAIDIPKAERNLNKLIESDAGA